MAKLIHRKGLRSLVAEFVERDNPENGVLVTLTYPNGLIERFAAESIEVVNCTVQGGGWR